MPEFSSQFANIFINYYGSRAASTCKLFISEPNLALEDQMGRLFGIIEINVPSRENPYIITQLIDALEESYYGETDENSEDIAAAFESALERVNQRFNQLIAEKKFYLVGSLNENTIKEKINLAVGVLHHNKLCVSYSNDISLYLVHKTKQDYKTIDLRQTKSSDEIKTDNAHKLFSNFMEGELNPPDYLFLSNSSFLNFVTLERIQKTITSLPIHKAAEYFKNSLLQTEGQNFAAIIVKNSSSEHEAQSAIPKSVTSISDLTKTESSTEKLLSPSFWSIAKGFGGAIMIPLKKMWDSMEKNLQERKMAAKQPALPSLNDETGAFEATKAPLGSLKLKLNKSFRKTLQRTPFYGEKMEKTKLWLRLKLIYLKTQLAKIPRFSKLLIAVVIAFVILFLFSTAYFKQVKNNSTDNPAFQSIVDQIEIKKAQAESDIIIGDEAKARTEIEEAQNILATLPINSQKQKESYQNLNSEIQAVIAKLRHIVDIEEPTLLANLSEENKPNIANLIFYSGFLLAFDSNNNSVFRYNLANKQQDAFTSNLSAIGKITKVKVAGNQILAYQDKNGFVEYKNGSFMPIALTLPANGKIIDFAFYNGRIYAADLSSNQIYRYTSSETGYDAGATWLKNPFDMKNILSLGIDSNIWLLDSTGKIDKFNKGAQKTFDIKNLDPGLEAPTQLLTSDGTNYIYVMEPKNNRVVVLDKEGQLITQYYSSKFDGLRAFDVSEKDKKMYLVNNNQIYSIDLTHIK